MQRGLCISSMGMDEGICSSIHIIFLSKLFSNERMTNGWLSNRTNFLGSDELHRSAHMYLYCQCHPVVEMFKNVVILQQPMSQPILRMPIDKPNHEKKHNAYKMWKLNCVSDIGNLQLGHVFHMWNAIRGGTTDRRGQILLRHHDVLAPGHNSYRLRRRRIG